MLKDMQQDDTRDILLLGISLCCGFFCQRFKTMTILIGMSFYGSLMVISGVDGFVKIGFTDMIAYAMNYETDSIPSCFCCWLLLVGSSLFYVVLC
jgi:hypothetical protein